MWFFNAVKLLLLAIINDIYLCRIDSPTTSSNKYLNCTQLFENRFYHELQQINPIKFWNRSIWTLKVISSECQFFIVNNYSCFINIAEHLVSPSSTLSRRSPSRSSRPSYPGISTSTLSLTTRNLRTNVAM